MQETHIPPPVNDASSAAMPACMPLYVDMDGTLVRGDTLHESVLLLLRRQPLSLFLMFWWLLGGRAAFKRRVAEQVCPDAALLNYHQPLLGWLRLQRAAGHPLVLATAADGRIAQAVADHLGLFSAVLASNSGEEGINLSRRHKSEAIARHARANGHAAFAYAGNSADDLDVWRDAHSAVVVDAPGRVLSALLRQHPAAVVFPAQGAGWRVWLKAIRITQWVKNVLLFVPVAAAHLWLWPAWLHVLGAFVAFGLCASATYLINDLLDLPNDRRHAHKRHRPLAAGRISVRAAVGAMAVMLPTAFALAWAVAPGFALMLGVYTAITLAYSLHWKRIALLDVLVLSTLYTLRLVAGAAAAGVALSNWLLAISLFLFLGLALVKRCAELEEVLLDTEVNEARGRGYHQDDLPGLRAMGVASGFLTVLVLALYIDSENSRLLYPHPEWLWGMAPLLLWWIMRLWLKTGRRELHGEDPLQFALHDRFSWWLFAAMGGLAALATWGG